MNLVKELGLHFITPVANLNSILQYGLLSRTEIVKRGLEFADISDHEVQPLRARLEPVFGRPIHDYVPLYLNPKNAMLSARRMEQDRLVILRIDCDHVAMRQPIFTDGNAAAGSTEFSLESSLLLHARSALVADYWIGVPDGRRRRMAEVLVHERIPPEAIERAVCNNRILAHRVREDYGLYAAVNPTMFF